MRESGAPLLAIPLPDAGKGHAFFLSRDVAVRTQLPSRRLLRKLAQLHNPALQKEVVGGVSEGPGVGVRQSRLRRQNQSGKGPSTIGEPASKLSRSCNSLAEAHMTQETSERILIELLHGQGAHVDPIACVEDITAELAGRKDVAHSHSIWQILCHLNYWMDYELKRIRGEGPVYPVQAADSWPSDSALPGEGEWSQAVDRFAALIDEFAVLAGSTQEVLRRQVSVTHPTHSQQSSSILAVLWQTIAHNSYHIGQMAILRRALGSWPPRRGGDTW
jgi:uncharacterized damage-inducible protein DinB